MATEPANPTTNVPAPTFSAAGFVAPPESAILAGVQADLNAAFGGNLNFTTQAGAGTNATPQAQLANSMAAIIGQANDIFVYYTNQTDPASAQGRMQDAIARIYFLTRFPAQATAVNALCTGLPGTTIPLGAIAQATDGNLYTASTPGVIGAGGNITLPFLGVSPGPITCPAHTLTGIFRAVPGWSGVDNPTDGVPGTNAESRTAFEQRRANSVAGNSTGALASVVGAIEQLPGVLSVKAVENVTGGTLTIGSKIINPHTLYVSCAGGLPQQIAATIWSKKAPGCATQGNATFTVYDQNSGYNPPLPSYQVSYTIPQSTPVVFQVAIVTSPNVPSNAFTLIDNALLSAFAGTDGQPRPQIGDTVFAARFLDGIKALTDSWGSDVISINLASPNSIGTVSFQGTLASGSLTVLSIVPAIPSVSSGTVQIGMILSSGTVGLAGTVPHGIIIVSQISGTPGGTGVYLVSNALAAFTNIPVQGLLPLLVLTPMRIDQIPTYNSQDINLVLTSVFPAPTG